MSDYYVYVYIDPRNFEEFYYGKGKDSRKDIHLTSTADDKKTERINAIHEAGEEPIIRVIARNLTEHEAFLIEKTLLWKLGRHLTNVAPGHFEDKFRPHDKMHLKLSGFDYKSGLYYFNVGDGVHRNWDDCRQRGFISAGQGPQWRDAICRFQPGDVLCAYLKNHGFVGVGRIKESAKPIREVTINGVPVLHLPLNCKSMGDNVESDDLCEHLCLVEWVRAVERTEAKWESKAGLYTTTHIRASLFGQPKTIAFLEKEFAIEDLRKLIE